MSTGLFKPFCFLNTLAVLPISFKIANQIFGIQNLTLKFIAFMR